jgi:hypothetical protein
MGLISPSSDPSKLAPQDLTAGTQSARCVAEKCRECFVESGAALRLSEFSRGHFRLRRA